VAALTEGEFVLLKKYNALLETVEEAFEYLSDTNRISSTTVTRQVVLDSHEAIGKIAEAHVKLVTLFEKNEEALQVISQFSALLDELEQIGHFDQNTIPEKEALETYIKPAYENWKNQIQHHILPRITH
jgi:DNA repair ATPase RecN